MESGSDDRLLLKTRLEREREVRREAEALAEKATRELRAALDAARAGDRQKGELLADLSHEIRVPLNAILGLTEIVLRTELSPIQREHLDTVLDSAETLLGVVDDVLEYARLEAGVVELARVPFDLRRTVDGALESLSDRAKEKGVALGCAIDERIPPRLVGDPDKLRQLVFHLVENAIQFTERGEISVRVEPEPSPEGERLHVSVRDTGIGVEPQHLDRIFEPFEQMDSEAKQRFGGSGLGLSICRKIVERMGGQLGADSTPGGGSTFHFTARFERASAAADAAREPAAEPAASDPPLRLALTDGQEVFVLEDGREVYVPPQRILLVEDSVANQKVATAILREHLHMVSVAENGKRALEQLERADFDLVLMDVEMPGMDGLEATRAIRAREEAEGAGRHLPIVAMTAHVLDGDRQRCLDAGMDDYVAKPVRRDAMFGAIRRVVGVEERRTGDAADAPGLAPLDAPAQSLVDWSGPLARVDGNRDVLREIVGAYLHEIREHLERLPHAIAAADAGEVRRRAYTLRGAMRMFGVVKAYQLAQELEELATRSASPTTEQGLLEHLRRAVEPVLPELERYIDTGEIPR